MGVEDPDWRSQQSQDAAAYGGIRIGRYADAGYGKYGSRVAESKRGRAVKPQDRANLHLRRPPGGVTNRTGAGAQPRSGSPSPQGRGRSRRRDSSSRRAARSGNRFTQADLVRGPNAAFEAEAQKFVTDTRKEVLVTRSITVRGVDPFAIRAPNAYRAIGMAGAGNQLISQLVDQYYQQKRLAQARRDAILGVGRRGGLATRPPQSVGLTNRTGAGATRPLAATSVGPRPSDKPANAPVAAPAQLVEVAPNARPAPATAPAAAPAARTSTRSSPAQRQAPAIAVNYDPWGMLQSALAPAGNRALATVRAGAAAARAAVAAFVTRPLPTTLTRAPGALPAISPALTPLNSTMLGLQPEPDAEEACKCKPKRKSTKPTCSNPLISRTTRDGVITIKRRLQCPPSR